MQSAIYAFENPSFQIEVIEKETPGNIPKITDKTALTTLLFLRLQERDLETIHNLHNAITFGDHSEAVWIGADLTSLGSAFTHRPKRAKYGI